ncbi:MAG: ParB/RepB/Spo0J family partition protein [Firmicutes bacterium]|nr:ParB/RepB/Spo0J family partition protein [Bacillota bacterium]
MPAPKRGLGRGLDSLLPSLEPRDGETAHQVEIERIEPNPHQPRRRFDEAALAELADSVRQHGVLQPLIVRRQGDRYQIVAGERRWRAAQLAGLKTVPVVVRDVDDQQMTEIALIENLQREDLNPIETARAYQAMMDKLGLDQEGLARRVGKSRSAVANSLRLLSLEEELQEQVASGRLTEGHARALLALPPGEARRQAARRIVDQGLSVRETEALARERSARVGPRSRRPRSAEVADLERALKEALAAPVRIRPGARKGMIEITYFGDEDLERLVHRMIGTRPAEGAGLI